MNSPDGHLSEDGERGKGRSRRLVEHHTHFRHLVGECLHLAALCRLAARSADHKIEVLLPPRLEVPHLVVQAVPHKTFVDVLAEKGTVVQKVEHEPPARDLGVMIASGVVLPPVPVLEGLFAPRTRDERGDQEARAEHSLPLSAARGRQATAIRRAARSTYAATARRNRSSKRRLLTSMRFLNPWAARSESGISGNSK